MASRKRSGSSTPVEDFAKQVGGWLGGAARGVQGWSESQARTFTNPYINAAGRALGKNPNLPTSGVREAVSNTAWAAADIASGPIARSAGKVVSNVGRTVVNTGVPARVVNKVTGQTVIIHGTDVRGLKAAGQQLMPSVPPARPDVGKVLFGVRASPMYDKENLARVAQHYAAERSFTKTSNKTFSGSAYVAKVPTKSLTGEGVTFVRSSAPGKIVSEIPVSGTTTNPTADFVERLDKAYKRAGGTYPKPPKAPKVKVSKKSGPVRS